MANFYEKNSLFFTERVFYSLNELMGWVQNKTFSLGYVIVRRRSKTNENGVVSYVTLICDRGGEYKIKATSKNSGTKKINCPFKLVGSYIKQFDGWTLRVKCDQHNHPPAQHMEGHAYARRLKENEKKLVADLTSQNVEPRNILSILKEHDENNVSILKTIYNAQYKLRSSQNDGKTPMQVLMGILNDKKFVIEFSVNNISNELENLFFIHPLSLDIWQAFPHVLIIDATYKTNKYAMPFVEIVGVTSTNKTFSIAFAFIINEKEESYKWVLTCLRLTLEKCMQPRAIVTDRELALVNACQQVFPYATRLLCRWHITENIRKHCKTLIPLKAEWKSFRAMWSILVESPTWTSYTENYRKLQSMLREHQDVLQYLDDVWLNKYKEMFVSVWIDQHLNFGQRTSSRVEGQHSALKKYLQEKNYSLAKFVGAIDRFVKSQLTAINESFEKSMIVSKHEHKFSCFDLLRGNVSIKALDMLVEELQRVHQVDSSNCGCKLQNSCGLPCACMLSAYLKEEPDLNEIPDLKEEPQSCYNHRLIDEIQVMFHPYITHIQDVEGDGNCGFRAISVCLGYGENDWLYVRRQLLDELLSSYDAYARVFTDGIGELYTSLNFLESPAPKRYWLLMPETGILIANRFGVVLTFLTNQGSLTFFPLWKGPEEFLYHRVITISLVYGNHYVMVQLEEYCPLPTISAFWIRHKAPCTARWETMFMSRLELYRQLKPYNPETPFITIEDC